MKKGFFFSSGSSTSNVDFATLILRFAFAGSLLYGHGLSKLNKLISGETIQFVDFLGLDVKLTYSMVTFAEFFCAALVVIGLLTRFALVPLIITMAYIVLVVHGADEFSNKELPLLYLAAFLAIMLIGPGKHSVDRILSKRKSTV